MAFSNSDNMNITGESFDYGPWRFTEFADPGFTAAYFDHTGLYAYGRQADAVAWNLAQFGNALARIAPADRLNELMAEFATRYSTAMVSAFHKRLGVGTDEPASSHDVEFVMDLLRWLRKSQTPIEQFFFDWFGGALSSVRAKASPIASHYNTREWRELEKRLFMLPPERPERLSHEYFGRSHPVTMLIDEVEAIWAPIDENDDWNALSRKIDEIDGLRQALDLKAE